MLSQRDYALLGVVLGTVLLTGSVFAFPNGFYPEYQYEVERVTMDDEVFVYGWATHAPEVRTCDETDASLACTFERRVRDDGPVVSDEYVRGRYDLVFFRNDTTSGTYYLATATELANGSYAHELEQLGPREALSVASLDADRLHPEFRRLLVRGEARSTTPIPGWNEWEVSEYHIVEYDGRYYRQDGFTYDGTKRGIEGLVRSLVGVVGLGILVVSLDRARDP
ncbi:hypothetical protein [Haloarchaeobius sp. HRN-SO-5]|uniref:hypothetical protein n=1 Tax=Haloarchaeobius sp. HRN-SO-5 TaxID=3446118 RepID=UPI003EB9FF2E